MKKIEHNIALRLVKALNLILMTAPFAACWYVYYSERTVSPYYAKGNWLIVALFAIIYFSYGKIFDGFLVSINRISEMVYSQTLAAIISDGIMYIITWLLMKHLPNIVPMLLLLVAQLVISILWCICAHTWYFKTNKPQKSAIIYNAREGMERLIGEYGMDKKFKVVCEVKSDACIADLSMLDGIETVFLSGIHSHDRNIILKYCVLKGISVYVIPRVGDVIMSGAKKMHMLHLPMLRVGRYNPNPEFLFIKRMADMVLSFAAIIILSPIMIVTAIIIKATDNGPVLYKQCRLTKDGKKFMVLKFRSMRVDAEKDGVARLSSGDKDDRITPIGKVIRKVRIDELPQLFNILFGDMSIVGPRPERPEIAEQYVKELPEFELRLQAKAGLTGYAQVYGKYNTTPYDKLQMDLMYIASPSVLADLKIMFATIKILFMPESTEGIAEGTTTAMEGSGVEHEVASTQEYTGDK
mgnify:FL=1